MSSSYNEIQKIFAKKGYAFFTGPFNINFFAVRGTPRRPDAFDDVLFVVYQDADKNPVIKIFEGTVDPGIPWLVHPMNPGGAAAIAPGQYRGVWQLGKFKNTDALIQCGKFKIFRDNNKDAIFDYDLSTIHDSLPSDGIFFHEHFQKPDVAEFVDKSSAGCVVPKRRSEHREIMKLLKLQSAAGLGNKFTFTLFNETDFKL
jgi:hypothetical protein